MMQRVHWPLMLLVAMSTSSSGNGVATIEKANSTIAKNLRPKFQDCLHYKPTLEEEQPPGTPVIWVNATDPDQWQTVEYSIVAIPGDQEFFTIDKTTGQIVSAFVFDRDAPFRDQEFVITVRATDNGSPSLDDVCTFMVTILDINDNPPTFYKHVYETSVTKDMVPNQHVTTISAIDMDERDNNNIRYEIVEEHEDSSYFEIDKDNGILTLAKSIDREPGQLYTFLVRAYNEGPVNTEVQQAKVEVKVRVIDPEIPGPFFIKMPMAPIVLNESFSDFNKILAEFEAVSNVNNDSNIIYKLVRRNYVHTNAINTFQLEQIDNTAYIKLGKSLDFETVTHYELAMRAINAVGHIAEVILQITILDENDNIPVIVNGVSFLKRTPFDTGPVMQVQAFDLDGTSANNIVSYRLSENSQLPFQIDTKTGLLTKNAYHGEESDIYILQIIAEDNSPSVIYRNGLPNMAIQMLIIKSDNSHNMFSSVNALKDNSQKQGNTEVEYQGNAINGHSRNEMEQRQTLIFVYNFHGVTSVSKNIGHVFVDDSVDWHLANKTFIWNEQTSKETKTFFKLNTNTGMITILEGTPPGQYKLRVCVFERSKHFPSNNLSILVTVVVKEISESSIDQSGSIRFFNVTAKEFMSKTPGHRSSPFQRLQKCIGNILNTNTTDVDIFTINNRKLARGTFLDVFFAVHDTDYSTSEVLNGVLSLQRDQLEEEVGFPIDMIGIDECVLKRQMCEQPCRNKVFKSNKPNAVNTNATSFVGITTFVGAECIIEASLPTCFNGGTLASDICLCPKGYDGLRCEMLDISFNGNGYAIYPSINGDNITSISIDISPRQTVGLVLYIGPLNYNPQVSTQPFLALELIDGKMVLLLDNGAEAFRIEDEHVFSHDVSFTVTIVLKPHAIIMNTVVNKLFTMKSRYEYNKFNGVLNTNGPIHLGGTVIDLTKLGSLYNWKYIPQARGFSGTMRSLIINEHTHDFRQFNVAKNVTLGHQFDIKIGEISYWFYTGLVVTLSVVVVVIGYKNFINKQVPYNNMYSNVPVSSADNNNNHYYRTHQLLNENENEKVTMNYLA